MTGPSPAVAVLLTGREVCQLLNISKSTLAAWRDAGELAAEPMPRGQWRYPSNQQLIQRVLQALGRCEPVA